MSVNPLPPQAYTKDTLQKAYAWLLTQNASVKDLAHDQNILVSLYLKAQRNGDAALETPSIQNFKQELKSLANLMGDFQTPQQLAQAAAVASTYVTASASPNVAPTPLRATVSSTPSIELGLDAKTQSAISEVREALNLSSDAEAIRALVALGIKQFRKANF